MTKLIYEEFVTEFDNKVIKRTSEQGEIIWIPADSANSDYQRYLRWLENPDAEENGTIS
jgi:hypothetical protein